MTYDLSLGTRAPPHANLSLCSMRARELAFPGIIEDPTHQKLKLIRHLAANSLTLDTLLSIDSIGIPPLLEPEALRQASCHFWNLPPCAFLNALATLTISLDRAFDSF